MSPLGARMVPFAGYAMPVQYPTGILAEHLWTREHAGLFDVSHMGQAALIGPDHATTARALEALVPADILNLKPGQQRYSQLLNENGGILDDLMVTRPADPRQDGELFLVVNASTQGGRLRPHRGAAAGRRRAAPRRRPRAARPAGAAGRGRARAAIAPERRLAFMQAADDDDRRHPGSMSRAPATPARTATRSRCRRARAAELVAAPAGDEQVKPIGLGARDSLRLEAGLCLYGHDIDTTTSPVEAGLAWSIQKRRREEGGFPGAARIQRELPTGPARVRVGLKPEGRAPAREGTDDRDAGRARGRQGHLGRLRPERQRAGRHGLRRARTSPTPGTDLHLVVRGKPLPAQVVAAAVRAASLQAQSGQEETPMTTRYTKDHEYIRVEGDTGIVGITDYAQSQLGDVVYVELPAVGKSVAKGGEAAVVESVKAASEVYAPVSGEVVGGQRRRSRARRARSTRIRPERGWFFKLKIANAAELDGLMAEDEYQRIT